MCEAHLSEPRQTCFLCGLDVVFGEIRYHLPFGMTQLHDLIIGDSTSHVPGQAQIGFSYFFDLLIHAVDVTRYVVGIQRQEAGAKKLAMSKLMPCSYSLLQLVHFMGTGLMSVFCRRLIT